MWCLVLENANEFETDWYFAQFAGLRKQYYGGGSSKKSKQQS
jgi:hypothetical protein